VLWLSENPCCHYKDYRLFVIKTLPQIIKLDNLEVTKGERKNAISMTFNEDR